MSTSSPPSGTTHVPPLPLPPSGYTAERSGGGGGGSHSASGPSSSPFSTPRRQGAGKGAVIVAVHPASSARLSGRPHTPGSSTLSQRSGGSGGSRGRPLATHAATTQDWTAALHTTPRVPHRSTTAAYAPLYYSVHADASEAFDAEGSQERARGHHDHDNDDHDDPERLETDGGSLTFTSLWDHTVASADPTSVPSPLFSAHLPPVPLSTHSSTSGKPYSQEPHHRHHHRHPPPSSPSVEREEEEDHRGHTTPPGMVVPMGRKAMRDAHPWPPRRDVAHERRMAPRFPTTLHASAPSPSSASSASFSFSQPPPLSCPVIPLLSCLPSTSSLHGGGEGAALSGSYGSLGPTASIDPMGQPPYAPPLPTSPSTSTWTPSPVGLVYPSSVSLTFVIEGMSCVSCASRVEAAVSKLNGVVKCVVDYARSTAMVTVSSSSSSSSNTEERRSSRPLHRQAATALRSASRRPSLDQGSASTVPTPTPPPSPHTSSSSIFSVQHQVHCTIEKCGFRVTAVGTASEMLHTALLLAKKHAMERSEELTRLRWYLMGSIVLCLFPLYCMLDRYWCHRDTVPSWGSTDAAPLFALSASPTTTTTTTSPPSPPPSDVSLSFWEYVTVLLNEFSHYIRTVFNTTNTTSAPTPLSFSKVEEVVPPPPPPPPTTTAAPFLSTPFASYYTTATAYLSHSLPTEKVCHRIPWLNALESWSETSSVLLELLLITPVVLYFGRIFFMGAWRALKHRTFTMDTLVAIGIGVTYWYSVAAVVVLVGWPSQSMHLTTYFDTAGLLTTFMLLGRFLEANAKRQTGGALLELMNLVPATATLVTSKGEDQWQEDRQESDEEDDEREGEERGGPASLEKLLKMGKTQDVCVPYTSITAGALLRVLAGDRIPVDGTVVEGRTEIDEQLVTGESVPRGVGVGGKVVGGTLNVSGAIVMRADKVGEDTMLANILRIVQDAQCTKPAVQRIADRIAAVFVPVVLGLALLTLCTWLVLGWTHAYPASWRGAQPMGLFAFEFFIATIVAACPCALGLATPTAIMVGAGMGARHGVLVKSAITLENTHRATCIIFDKTGTLTTGKLEVVRAYWPVHPFPLNALPSSFHALTSSPRPPAVREAEENHSSLHTARSTSSPMPHAAGLPTWCFAATGTVETPLVSPPSARSLGSACCTTEEVKAILHVVEASSHHPIAAAICAALSSSPTASASASSSSAVLGSGRRRSLPPPSSSFCVSSSSAYVVEDMVRYPGEGVEAHVKCIRASHRDSIRTQENRNSQSTKDPRPSNDSSSFFPSSSPTVREASPMELELPSLSSLSHSVTLERVEDPHRLTDSPPRTFHHPEEEEEEEEEAAQRSTRSGSTDMSVTEASSSSSAANEDEGFHVWVGNERLLHRSGIIGLPPDVVMVVEAERAKGRAIAFGMIDAHLYVVFSLMNPPRDEAAGVVSVLQRRGLRTMLVTGDHARAAANVATAVGISPEDVHADVLPVQKVHLVKEAQAAGYHVMFVGDGINDAPALVQADVGVALGAGTEVAIDAADAVLIRDSLVDLLNLVDLSTATVRRVYGNFIWAMGYNILILPLAMGLGLPLFHTMLPPLWAGFAMVCSSLCVLLFSLSLGVCFRPWKVKHLLSGARKREKEYM